MSPNGTTQREISTQQNQHKRKRSYAALEIPQPSKQRRRIACHLCRAKKVRCDAGRPKCGFCKLNDTVCEYEEPKEVEEDTPELTGTYVVDRLERILSGIETIQTSLSDTAGLQGPSAYPPEQFPIPQTQLKTPESQQSSRQPAKDYLRIPTCQATADTVLTWPIFKHSYPSDALIAYFFQLPDTVQSSSGSTLREPAVSHSSDVQEVKGGMRELHEERIPALIDRFLQNVHTKNPILDVDALVLKGRRASVKGLAWDADSCLVLLACALGSISFPFVRALRSMDDVGHQPSSIEDTDLQMGETCFVLACRRLGLLKYTVIGAQCQFFAAVYLMYTFRPLQAWNHFIQASTYYQFFLRSVGGPSSEHPVPLDLDRLQHISRLQRRIEQSLYWSCFKSEVEMRVELPLVQSTLANFEYPDLFPSPPSPDAVDAAEAAVDDSIMPPNLRQAVDAEYSSSIRKLRRGSSGSLPVEAQELRKHSRSLYNEEESWYYYLTEVALRRISNRIVNTFFGESRESWMDIGQFLPMALEFDTQISTWSANLPPAMQTFAMPESPSDLKELSKEDLDRFSVSKELSWCTENRILEMRSWLFQPFLYYIVHENLAETNPQHAYQRLSPSQRQALDKLVQEGVNCNLKILEWRTIPHRHHGIWFDLRAVITAVITLTALARSDPSRIPDCLFRTDPRNEFQDTTQVRQTGDCINIDIVLERLRFWENESPDVQRARVMLEEFTKDTRSILAVTRGSEKYREGSRYNDTGE